MRALRSVLWVTVAAALLAASFPPLDLGPVLAWVALLPLLAALQGQTCWRAFALGGLFGLLVNLSLFASLFPIPRLHGAQLLPLCLLFAGYPATWCALMAGREPRAASWPWLGASLWALLEYAKAHAGFLAFPVGSLAQTQVDDACLLQTASLFGEPAISFLVALGNLWLWQARLRVPLRSLALGLTPIALAFAFGAWTLLRDVPAPAPAIRVAVLHSNFSAFGPGHVSTTERMVQTAAFLRRTPPTDARLVVLPESSFVNLSADPALLAALHAQADAAGQVLVAGVAQALKFDRAGPIALAPGRRVRAGAWVFDPGRARVRRYDKVRRLPFAEYLPLPGVIAWPTWLVSPPLEVVEARGAAVYPTSLGVRLGIMVCWESVFADHARGLARDGASMLLQLSNEGWFAGTAAGRKHNATLRLRAVETGRPVLAAVNAGPAIITDRFGRIVASGSGSTRLEWVSAAVVPSSAPTLYLRLGDRFVLVCALLSLLILVRPRPRRVRHAHPPDPMP